MTDTFHDTLTAEARANSIIRTINRAEDAHYILTGMARAQTSGATGPKVDTSSTPGVPLNLTMHDLAVDLQGILRDLALDIAAQSGDWPDGLDVPAAGLYIRQHASTLVGHEGHETDISTLSALYRKATGVLGMLPRRTKIPEHCECGHEQWVYHEHVPFVRCKGGHLAPLADHAYSASAKHFTAAQAARILGVHVATIGRMLERGDLYGVKGTKAERAYVDATSVTVFARGLAGTAAAM